MFQQGFLREHSSTLVLLVATLDALALMVSAYAVFQISEPVSPQVRLYQIAVFLGTVLTFLSFSIFKLYTAWRGANNSREAGTVIAALTSVFFVLVLLMFMTKTTEEFSRVWTGSWYLSSCVLIICFRMGVRSGLSYLRKRGYNLRHIVIFSTAGVGNQVLRQLGAMPDAGFNVSGYFAEKEAPVYLGNHQTKCIGSIEDGIEFLNTNRADQVWIAMPLSAEQRIEGILNALPYLTADLRLIPDMSSFRLINHSISQLGDMPVINLSMTPIDGTNRILKSFEDKLLASLILLLISPLLIGLAIGVKLSSPGPVFYRQKRVSWNGKSFKMYKFRSMPVDAEAQSGAVWAKEGENRATAFGSFLRRTSLDELPQFWNVLKGDMSIVGPRPERPVFVNKFKTEIPGYMQKHMVKAGITGWAQVNGWRGDTDLEKRIEYDLYYIENWSLWFDLRIIFLTIFKGFVNKNAY